MEACRLGVPSPPLHHNRGSSMATSSTTASTAAASRWKRGPPLLHSSSSPSLLQPSQTFPMLHTPSGPLMNCHFYLDMSDDDARKSSIERQLKMLAARVEEQFNGDIVTHIITTRHLTHEQKVKIQQQAFCLSNSSSSLSSSSISGPPLQSAISSSSSSTLALSQSSLHSPNTSSQLMSSSFLAPPVPLTSSSTCSATLCLSVPVLTVPSTSTSASTTASPNSPISSAPSSPFSTTSTQGSSYPPPQASSSPSSPSLMTAYGVAGNQRSLATGHDKPVSLIEQLRHTPNGKRRESHLPQGRRVTVFQPQPADMDSEDVIALAYRLGKKIYHIDKFAPWLDKHCGPCAGFTSSAPRRGNESAQTTMESPIGSPQPSRQFSTQCPPTVSTTWSKSVDTSPCTVSPTLTVPVLHLHSTSPPATIHVPAQIACPPTTTNPLSSNDQPSFQVPVLVVEDLKGQFKTMYKEFPYDSYGCSTVPFLNLDTPPGCSPFLDSETIRKHKEMQRQYQQKLEQRKRDKVSAMRPKRSTPRRSRDRSPPQALMQEPTIEMWEGEDGGGMADSSLQVPHPFRVPSAVSSASAVLLMQQPLPTPSHYSPAPTASTPPAMYQRRPTSLSSTSTLPSPYSSSARASPTTAFPTSTLHSSPVFSSAPRPSPPAYHRSYSQSSLLARAHNVPTDWIERHSTSCLPPESSGRVEAMVEDDGPLMQRSV